MRLLYRDPADRQLLTRLARAVMAMDDDPVMTGILDAGCDYLVALANVLRRQLGTAQRWASESAGRYARRRLQQSLCSWPIRLGYRGQIAARAPEFGAADLRDPASSTIRSRHSEEHLMTGAGRTDGARDRRTASGLRSDP